MTKKKTTTKTPDKKTKEIQQESNIEKENLLIKLTQSKFFRFSLIGLITFILIFSIYSYIQHKIYQDSLSNLLPLDTTYTFLEVKNSEFLDQKQRLESHPNSEQITQILNFQEAQLNQTKLTPILKQASQKNISIQVFQDQKYPLFIYEIPKSLSQQVKFPLQVIQKNSDQKWYYALKENILTISSNKEVGELPFQENIKVTSSNLFQDAYQNTPNHNIAWFAINHTLGLSISQDSKFPNNTQSYLQPISQFLGFSVGYLNINTQGLLVGVYSNPSPDLNINLSPLRNLDKFSPKLHKYLPPLQEIDTLISATDSFSILNLLLQNNPDNQVQLQNLATKRNLTLEDLNTIKSLFSSEYLIYKQKDTYKLVLPEITNEQKENLLALLSNLEAFHNPKINSHRLEDGSYARTKSPSEPITRKLENQSELYDFRLTDINQSIQADFSHKDHIILTYAPNQTTIQSPSSTLEQEQQRPEEFFNLLPQASSHLYLSEDQTLNFIKEQDLNLYPANINSSSYFFNDGIQILLQLTW